MKHSNILNRYGGTNLDVHLIQRPEHSISTATVPSQAGQRKYLPLSFNPDGCYGAPVPAEPHLNTGFALTPLLPPSKAFPPSFLCLAGFGVGFGGVYFIFTAQPSCRVLYIHAKRSPVALRYR